MERDSTRLQGRIYNTRSSGHEFIRKFSEILKEKVVTYLNSQSRYVQTEHKVKLE